MRRVRKGVAPPCLDSVRREVARIESEARELTGEESPLDDIWGEVKGDCKSQIQDHLIRDQDGLCAYCGGRLRKTTMKIEHFEPRAAEQDRILDWSNLLGCCPGEYRQGHQTVTHCDSSRTPYDPKDPKKNASGKWRLRVHPVDSPTPPGELFVVNITSKRADLGVISAAPAAVSDLAELNLNAPRLVQNRASVIRDLRSELQGRKDVIRFLKQRYRAATIPGPNGLPAYAHVVAAYTRRKLRQRGESP